MAKPRFQAPKGTRDLYPEDMLRRRYVTQTWRDTSIRHGFEEIDGPTFETSELYAVKSGDGILNELFQAFSGKDPKDLEFIKENDRAQLALRPEFTPTLARLYAAKAAQLPKPTKWTNIGPRFRAERPQRGRGREFLQFDCDVLGTPTEDNAGKTDTTVAIMSVLLDTLDAFDLAGTTAAHVSDRNTVQRTLAVCGLGNERAVEGLQLLDQRAKLPTDAFATKATDLGLDLERFDSTLAANDADNPVLATMRQLGYADRVRPDYAIVRGLAYYTGTVFEVIADGERSVAGGGRYDSLIELLGGPSTPAVGFAMGDMVLSLLLEDKGLMPEGPDLLEACSRPGASLRPEVFVITGDEELDPTVRRLVADLRRGTEAEGFEGKPWAADRYTTRPLHARRSYKSTRNIGKLIKDATGQHAKALVIIENQEHATVQDLDRKDKLENIALVDVPAKVAQLTSLTQ
ncbi:MAG: ATP phosphoribosyltransferase regulatory subunit [Planctomycetota bacterium]